MPYKDPAKNAVAIQAWRERNRDKLRRQCREWYQKNREKQAIYSRTWKRKNCEKVNAASRAHYRRNREKAIARSKEWARKQRKRMFAIIAEAHGDIELRCRIDLTPDTSVSDLPCRGTLQIDHLNGGGTKENRALGGPRGILRAIENGERNPTDYRLLCQLHQLWNTIGIPQAGSI